MPVSVIEGEVTIVLGADDRELAEKVFEVGFDASIVLPDNSVYRIIRQDRLPLTKIWTFEGNRLHEQHSADTLAHR